jgi:hypothetical protein
VKKSPAASERLRTTIASCLENPVAPRPEASPTLSIESPRPSSSRSPFSLVPPLAGDSFTASERGGIARIAARAEKAPAFRLHAHERFSRAIRTTSFAIFASTRGRPTSRDFVVLASRRSMSRRMPAEDRLGLRARRDLRQRAETERLAESGELAALLVLQRDARSESRPRHAILGDQVLVPASELDVDAAGDRGEDGLPGHREVPGRTRTHAVSADPCSEHPGDGLVAQRRTAAPGHQCAGSNTDPRRPHARRRDRATWTGRSVRRSCPFTSPLPQTPNGARGPKSTRPVLVRRRAAYLPVALTLISSIRMSIERTASGFPARPGMPSISQFSVADDLPSNRAFDLPSPADW